MKIDDREISIKHRPYLIAELSANHDGNIDKALELIELAKCSGADAVKLQTYTPETMTIDCDSSDFLLKEGLWQGKSLYELYSQAFTPWEWHTKLFEKARSLDLTIFSSPFDETAVDFLESLNVPAYKLASFEMKDLPLVEKIVSTNKPIIVSTGMSELNEIYETASILKSSDYVLLHCISEYPAIAENYQLNALLTLKNEFNTLVGLSDHTITNDIAIASIAMGACVIEKHFTDSRKNQTCDSAFSLEPHEFLSLRKSIDTVWQAIGSEDYLLQKRNDGNQQFRRSIYVVQDISKGEIFNENNIKRIRPGYGLAPKYFHDVIGKKASRDISRGSALNFEMIDYEKR